jgi:hypothetical protein
MDEHSEPGLAEPIHPLLICASFELVHTHSSRVRFLYYNTCAGDFHLFSWEIWKTESIFVILKK